MEDWIVDQLKAITVATVAVFDPADVRPYEGLEDGKAFQTLVNDLFTGKRGPWARVLFESDNVESLQEGAIRIRPTYVVLVGIENGRPEAARRGDGTYLGTNLMRDLLKTALHDKVPGIGNANTYVDRTTFAGSNIVYNSGTRVVQQTRITTDESPAA